MKNNNRLAYLLIGLLVVWSLILTVFVFDKDDRTNSTQIVNEYKVDGFSTDFTEVIDVNKTSVVSINCNGAISSGFVYKQDDNKVYIVTTYHGLNGGVISVSFNNVFNAYASLLGHDKYSDLAVIQIESPYSIKPLTLADSSILKDGEFVVSIGTPSSFEYAGSVELGMVSSDTRVIENSITVDDVTSNYYLDVIQLSANLKPGYSGSPVLNMNGEVVGMVTMNIQDGFNFAITSNEIKIIADKLISEQQVTKYQLGIKGSYIENMPMFERSNLNLSVETIYGLYVEKLLDGSVALPAGIKAGDVILSINDVELHNMNDYLNVVYSETGSLKFEVLRDGSISNYTVNLND